VSQIVEPLVAPERDDEATRAREIVRGRLFETAPLRIGRFVVLERVGAGGLGIVYAAYDTELDRRVALKVSQRGPDGSTDASEQANRALVREAKAIAALSHPHVVVVYDAGVIDGGEAYLAMEFVEGRTLAAWLREEQPSWRDVLGAYLQAGDGLAAAHAIGVVHRDFKPHNAMIDANGRVRVLDFGLAHAHRGEPLARDEERPVDEHATTLAGLIAGTPAYMAPEQIDGAAVDARADQFAFCVALWEALYGSRPYPGRHLAALRLAIEDRALAAPTHRRGPARLRSVLARGLAASASARWPDMASLLVALRAAARRRRTALLALGGATIVAGTLAFSATDDRARCDVAPDRIAPSWNEARAAAIAHSFAAIPFANDSALGERVTAVLDARARAWTTSYSAVCTAGAADPDWAHAELDRRMACLDRVRGELGALADVLATADAGVAARAMQAIAELPDAERCVDAPVDALGGGERAEDAAPARERLERARALRSTGRMREAEPLAAEALALADASGDPDAIAEAEILAAELADPSPASLEHYERAMRIAASHGRSELAARAATGAISAAATGTDGDLRRAFDWVRHAESWSTRAGLGPKHLATIAGMWGQRLEHSDKDAAARAQLMHAIALRTDAPGGELSLTTLQLLLSRVESKLGHHEQARDLAEHALADAENEFGSDHPELVKFLVGSATVGMALGDFPTARARLERAVAIFTTAYGPDHPQLMIPLHDLAAVAYATGDYATTYANLDRSIPMAERQGDEQELMIGLYMYASALYQEDEYARALPMIERAVVLCGQLRGEQDPELANHLSLLANILVEVHRGDEAVAALDRAVEIDDRFVELDDPAALSHLENLARVHRQLRHPARAAEIYAVSLQRREDAGQTGPDTAQVRFRLARALWEAKDDRPAAIALAKEALADVERPTTPGVAANIVQSNKTAEQIAAWIRDRE
jgi:tetratricopeptide (TPR) repeat protein